MSHPSGRGGGQMLDELGASFATIYVDHFVILRLLLECSKGEGGSCAMLKKVYEEHKRKELELGLPTVDFDEDPRAFCSKFIRHVEEIDEILRRRLREVLEHARDVCAAGF